MHRIFVVLAVSILGLFFAEAGSIAAKPEKCSDWPTCKDDGGGSSGEDSSLVEPVVILNPTDSIPNAVTLQWIVPATSGGSPVKYYEVRYGKALINDLPSFEAAALAEPSTILIAAEAGTLEYFTIRRLDVETLYFFGLRASDDKGNASELLPTSFISATTQRTALPNLETWQVETIADVAEDRRQYCCRSTSGGVGADCRLYNSTPVG